MPLNTASATSVYNYFLKKGEKRNLTCQEHHDVVDIPEKELTDAEAKCYWENYPNAAEKMTTIDLELNATNASFSWNYFNKHGDTRSYQCK